MNAPVRDVQHVAVDADFTIDQIDVIPIRVELDQVFRGSYYRMTHRSTVVTRVRTQGGLVGEAYCGDEDATLGEIVAVIRDEITPKLVGTDVRLVERCWEQVRPVTFDILRDRRIGLVASACVDAAIWDAVGKSLGEPLWRLWGGYRNALPVISIGGYYGTDTPIEEEIGLLRANGVAGMKFKVGGQSPRQDADRVHRARGAAGDDFAIAVDANQGWSTREAIDFVQRAQEANILWFEEPCNWQNDLAAMRDVRLSSGVPVCAGQSELSAAGCRRLMENGAIDVCNFDSSWSGGPTEWRRAAAVAATTDVAMAHHEEPQIAAHLLASIPHGTYLEQFSPSRDPIWFGLVSNRPEIVDGSIELSDRPGFGWELDEDFIARHRIDVG